MIPSVIVPITHEELLNALKDLLHNNNSKIKEFEEELSSYIGCDHSIATYRGITALYVLLKSYGLKRGDEVIMPAYTCETVARLLIDMGFKMNFVDVDKGTYNISIEDLQSNASRKTKAIIAIHMFGNPCEMKGIMEIAEGCDAVVIEDAAQSIGAEYRGKKIGSIGDAGFFSLGEGKPLTTINGGVIVTNDKGTAEKCRRIIEHFNACGLHEKSIVLLKLMTYYILKNPHHYDLIYKLIQHRRVERRNKLRICTLNKNNFKFRWTDMQASVGLIQLLNLERFNDARMRNAAFLMENLKYVEGIHLPKVAKHSKPIFLRLPVWFEHITARQRDELIEKLRKAGIDAPVAYPNPLPAFFLGVNGFPNTEELVKKTITLPTHPFVRESDLERTVFTIEQFVEGVGECA